jgi:hypothetical protein
MNINIIIKLILSIGMVYNIVIGKTQTAILLGICIIINLLYERK